MQSHDWKIAHTTRAAGWVLVLLILLATVPDVTAATGAGWPIVEGALKQKSSAERLTAVRVLALIPDDPHAVLLAENALKDPSAPVRAAAATALGQMHASGADTSLKLALKDKDLSVVMAAAHALRLHNDPACYETYYEILTGERKTDSGMIAQEKKVLHDPKQVTEMGFNEGIGYVPFASIPWKALQTIMKDRKDGAAVKAALIAALAADPDSRTNKVLITTSQNRNWVLRVAALEAIAKRGDPSLLPLIAQRLQDPRREVKYTAAAAVIHLTNMTAHSATKTASVVHPRVGESPMGVPDAQTAK